MGMPSNALNISQSGLVGFDGTGNFVGSTTTEYNVLVGGSSNDTIANVAPGATSGVPLVSQGSSTNPHFGTAVVAGGGTGATTLTGVLIGNGTSAITGNAITQHDVLVGGASNAITSVAPSATSGVPFISQGSSSNPTFGTAVVAGGGTGDTSFTAYAPICGGTTTTGALQSASTGLSTSGYVLTSNGASSLPTFLAIPAASITIDGDTGSATGSTITIEAYNGGKAGATVKFVGSGSTLNLNLADSNDNITIGRVAGNTTQSGSSNISMGAGSLQNLSSGNDNVAIGQLSMLSLSSGQDNTGVGYACLQSNSTSNLNSGLGYSALAQCTGSNNTGLGATTLGSLQNGSYNTGCGEASLPYLGSGSYNHCFGYSSGVNYNGSESSNICIGNNGTASESNVIRIGTQGSGSAQQDACYIAGILGVTVSNQEFVTINSSTGQLGVTSSGGVSTIDGDSGSVTGSTITLEGYSGGLAGATVSFVGSGSTMKLEMTDSLDDIFIGRAAGTTTLTGQGRNIGIGASTLSSLTDANENVAIGYTCLESATSGSSNVAIGYDVLSSITTGQYNTAIGLYAGSNYTSSESGNICIFNSGVLGESSTIRIGSQGGADYQQDTCYIAGITGSTVTGTAVLCSSSGQLGTISSSRRYKENISEISDKQSILDLTPVEFNYKSDPEKVKFFGLIAEEVHEKFPELCLYKDNQPDSLKYHEMPALLLKEIQRLEKRVSELEKKLAG